MQEREQNVFEIVRIFSFVSQLLQCMDKSHPAFTFESEQWKHLKNV